jgi:hypothetical protein
LSIERIGTILVLSTTRYSYSCDFDRHVFDPHLVCGMVATYAPAQSNCSAVHSRAHDSMIHVVCFDTHTPLINIKSQRNGVARKPTSD